MVCVFLLFSCIMIVSWWPCEQRVSGGSNIPPTNAYLSILKGTIWYWLYGIPLGINDLKTWILLLSNYTAKKKKTGGADTLSLHQSPPRYHLLLWDIYVAAVRHSAVSVTFFMTGVICCIRIDTHTEAAPAGPVPLQTGSLLLNTCEPPVQASLFTFIPCSLVSSRKRENSSCHHCGTATPLVELGFAFHLMRFWTCTSKLPSYIHILTIYWTDVIVIRLYKRELQRNTWVMLIMRILHCKSKEYLNIKEICNIYGFMREYCWHNNNMEVKKKIKNWAKMNVKLSYPRWDFLFSLAFSLSLFRSLLW